MGIEAELKFARLRVASVQTFDSPIHTSNQSINQSLIKKIVIKHVKM
jgi:hypothetical protein